MPEPVKLDFSKAQPITLDFTKSQPLNAAGDQSAADTRNNWQKAFDELAAPPDFDIHHPFISGAEDFGAGVFGLMAPLFHPRQTGKTALGLMSAGLGIPSQFTQDAQEGLITPFIRGEGEKMGTYASRLAAQGISSLPSVAAPEILRDLPFLGRDPIAAYRSSAIPRTEAIARSAADVLKPNPAAYRGTVATLTEHAPAIRDFAASTGNRLGTPLDFAKAAQGAGQESSNFFSEHLVEPNAELPTPFGSVGDVYQRLRDINDELRPAYRQRTGGQELTALERKKLETERDRLNDTLYGTLSERSGLSPEEVQRINRRGGALQNLADEVDAAQAMRRSGFSGYTPTGLPIPMTTMERALRLVQYLRGGPEATAGARLRGIMKLVDRPSEALPNPEAIGGYRRMAEQADLGHLRDLLDEQAQNRANSAMRRSEWRTAAGTAERKLR